MTPYLDRKLGEKCTYPGCEEPPGDTNECDRHRDEHRARAKKSASKRRARWARKRRCTRCGRKRSAKSSWGCVRCLTQLGRLRSDAATHVDKSERIAARLIPWRDSPTNANRVRLRGGSRGRQPIVVEDRFDLGKAKECVVDGLAGIEFFWSPEVQSLPRAQAAEVRAAALSKLEQCKRWIDEVLVRNGMPRPVSDGAE